MTTRDAALCVVRTGFQEVTGYCRFTTDNIESLAPTGVWFADAPFSVHKGAKGDSFLGGPVPTIEVDGMATGLRYHRTWQAPR
jgi:hypothetical protein